MSTISSTPPAASTLSNNGKGTAVKFSPQGANYSWQWYSTWAKTKPEIEKTIFFEAMELHFVSSSGRKLWHKLCKGVVITVKLQEDEKGRNKESNVAIIDEIFWVIKENSFYPEVRVQWCHPKTHKINQNHPSQTIWLECVDSVFIPSVKKAKS